MHITPLIGSLPLELEKLGSLHELALYSNQLTGSLPSKLEARQLASAVREHQSALASLPPELSWPDPELEARKSTVARIGLHLAYRVPADNSCTGSQACSRGSSWTPMSPSDPCRRSFEARQCAGLSSSIDQLVNLCRWSLGARQFPGPCRGLQISLLDLRRRTLKLGILHSSATCGLRTSSPTSSSDLFRRSLGSSAARGGLTRTSISLPDPSRRSSGSSASRRSCP